MKRVMFFIACCYLFTGNVFAQNTDKKDIYKQVEKELNALQKQIEQGLYYSAYETIESITKVVEDEKQTTELFSKIQKLKKLSPQKPESECANLKEQQQKGKKIPAETLYFYDCIKE